MRHGESLDSCLAKRWQSGGEEGLKFIVDCVELEGGPSRVFGKTLKATRVTKFLVVIAELLVVEALVG